MRARNIKPNFFKNDELAELPFSTRLLFIGLWCYADRDGFFEARIKKLKAEIFPYDHDKDLLPWEQALCSLAQSGFIQIYHPTEETIDNDGKPVENPIIKIVNFSRHQRPHQNEKSSVYKDIIKTCNLGNNHLLPRNKALRSECGMMNDECGMMNEESISPEPSVPGADGSPDEPTDQKPGTLDLFNLFWEQYPRKDKKVDALKAWKQIKKLDQVFDAILHGLSKSKMSRQWNKDHGEFIPLPATWIRAKQWEDKGVQHGFQDSESSAPKSRYENNMAVADRMIAKAEEEKRNGNSENSEHSLEKPVHSLAGSEYDGEIL